MSRARNALLPLVLAVAVAGLAFWLDRHEAIEHWFFWRCARYWLLCCGFGLACLSAGHTVLRAARARQRPLREHLVFAMAIGVYVFFAGMFVAGVARLYGSAFAVTWPLGLIALGGPSLLRHVRARVRRLRALKRVPRPRSALLSLVLAFGLVYLVVVYVTILSPDNVTYDARWYHLPLAEHYAAEARVSPSPEGWYQASLPHLASFLYTWAFLLPDSSHFDRFSLAAHLEFTLFLWTLASIPVLVRRLVPGADTRGTWVALFLFHIVFLPSNIATAADNVAAFWAIPTYLAFLDAWQALKQGRTRGTALLFALFVSGGLMTKYQAASIVAFPLLAIALGAGWLLFRKRTLPGVTRLQPVLWLAAAAGWCLVLTAPHWLKNLVWYGDPLYPFLHRHLTVHPWTADSANLFEHVFRGQLWQPQGTLPEKLRQTASALLTFAFVPNDWPEFHGATPLFGALFTLSLPALLFLKDTRRVWLLVACTHVGIAVWYWMSHQDRYLIGIVPWMACAVAATALLVSRQSLLTRSLFGALVGLEVVWASTAPLLPIHPALHVTPLVPAFDLLTASYRKQPKREHTLQPYDDIRKTLPPRAKVLVHEMHMHAGLGSMSVSDWGPWQGGISYGRLGNARAAHELLHGFGVTHVLWHAHTSQEADSLAGDLVFFDLAYNGTAQHQSFGHLTLAALPKPGRLPDNADDRVVIFGCSIGYGSGSYRLAELVVPTAGPTKGSFPKPFAPPPPVPELATSARYVVVERACAPADFTLSGTEFSFAAKRKAAELWIRKSPLDRRATTPEIPR